MQQENFDIKNFLRENGYPVRDAGHEIQSVCLWRGGQKYNLSINKKTLRWYDFVEQNGGSIEKLIELIGGDPEILEQNFHFTQVEDEIKLPKKLDISILDSLKPDYTYWIKRKISEEICIKLRGGVSDNETMPKFNNRHIIPIFDEQNNLAGLTGRYLGNSNSKFIAKYKHFNPKKTFIWPRDPAAIYQNSVILTESPACCMSFLTCGINNSLCLFGVNISDSIINYLVANSVKKIIIATNNEPDNNNIGNLAAEKIKKKLVNFFDNVEIKLPPKNKDINDWLTASGQNEIVDFYSESILT